MRRSGSGRKLSWESQLNEYWEGQQHEVDMLEDADAEERAAADEHGRYPRK